MCNNSKEALRGKDGKKKCTPQKCETIAQKSTPRLSRTHIILRFQICNSKIYATSITRPQHLTFPNLQLTFSLAVAPSVNKNKQNLLSLKMR